MVLYIYKENNTMRVFCVLIKGGRMHNSGRIKKIVAVCLAAVIVILGAGIIVSASPEEYKVHHNITIDLGGGYCQNIYYQSSIDDGDRQGWWYDDLRIGDYLPDKHGIYHTIADYNPSLPRDGETVSNYYDCVGVTPYVTITGVRRNGYHLTGWSVDGSTYEELSDGVRVEIGAYVKKDISITANWERNTHELAVEVYYLNNYGDWSLQNSSNVKARVSIDAAGKQIASGAAQYSGEVEEDSLYNISVSAEYGWEVDWNLTSQLSGSVTGDKIVRIYMKPGYYTVKFNQNASSGIQGSMKDVSLCKVRRQAIPKCGYSRTGYTFAGWNTDSSGNGKYIGDEAKDVLLTPSANNTVVLYAIWKPVEYTVRLHADKPLEASESLILNSPAGWKMDPDGYYYKNFVYDRKETIPDISQAYRIKGWSPVEWSDASGTAFGNGGTEVYNFSSDAGSVIELHASWRENTYNIVMDSNGGYNMDSNIIAGYEKNNELPDAPVRPGYNFKSWNTMKDGTGDEYKDKDKVSKLTDEDKTDVIMYAQWKQKPVVCLRIASDIYGKALVNDASRYVSLKWMTLNGNMTIKNTKDITEDQCEQIWTINESGIYQKK